MGEGDSFCPHCYRDLWKGGSCKRRTCPGYARTYLGDQARRVKANLAAWDGQVCMVTLTAPGKDVLPWDVRKCLHPAGVRCSGRLGCRVHVGEAARWNADVTARLGALLKVARENTRRWSRRNGGGEVVVLAYVLEAQERGVFHPHVVLGYRTGRDRAALDVFRGHLKRARGEYGFGRGSAGFDAGKAGWFPDAGKAASYISKYLRSDGRKASIVPLLANVGAWCSERLVRPVYVNPKLTRLTGVTGAYLRWRRWCFVAWGRRDLPADDAMITLYRMARTFGLVPGEGAFELVPRSPARAPAEACSWPARAATKPGDWAGVARERSGMLTRPKRFARDVVSDQQVGWPF